MHKPQPYVIVNPLSASGNTGKIWPELQSKLQQAIGEFKVLFTDAPLAATELTRTALKEGAQEIIAVGGDGTVNEVINGFFEADKPINPKTTLGVVMNGTGQDFVRTHNLPEDHDTQIKRLVHSRHCCLDVGKITFHNHRGEQETRYFGEIASFGLSGATDQVVNRLKYRKWLGGKAAFWLGMVQAMWQYKPQRVRLSIDDASEEEIDITTVAVCNGQYFGGGMRIAPDAQTDDGLFDIVILEGVGKPYLLWNSRLVYSGKHLRLPVVRVVQGKKVQVMPANKNDAVLLDIDGEAPGRLPATFEIMPNALVLRR